MSISAEHGDEAEFTLVVFHQIFGMFKVPPSRRPGILVAGLPMFARARPVFEFSTVHACCVFCSSVHHLPRRAWPTFGR